MFILRQSHAVHPRPQSIPNIPDLPGMDRNGLFEPSLGNFWLGLLFTSVFFGTLLPPIPWADFGVHAVTPMFVSCTFEDPKVALQSQKVEETAVKGV